VAFLFVPNCPQFISPQLAVITRDCFTLEQQTHAPTPKGSPTQKIDYALGGSLLGVRDAHS